VLFLPLTLFWSGAWMRRPHGPIKWTLAACLLLFSIAVTLIGATDPYRATGYDHYTAAEAVAKLINPPPRRRTRRSSRAVERHSSGAIAMSHARTSLLVTCAFACVAERSTKIHRRNWHGSPPIDF
jgi:hypothetical protein